ncbi:MAG: hypothetical protein H0T18_01695 [Chloroflexia bacterium]|nr:hypothetical protein [Chloroflexia bacterium]
MPQTPFSIRHVSTLAMVLFISIAMVTVAGAQSQEPKPVLPATPGAESGAPPLETATTGVSGSSWLGPNWGVGVSWDPSVWTVEGEFIEAGYDGLQIGTPISTVYLETYNRFDGDADACFADAERELGEREGVSEVVPLTGRPLPVPEDARGAAELFGITATLADGALYRGIEYIECRTVVPGEAVLEITWQTVTGAFNEDLPNVETLLAAIVMPERPDPAATPAAPVATPIA